MRVARIAAVAFCVGSATAFFAGSVTALAPFEGVAEFKASTTGGRGETIPGRGTFYIGKNAVRGEWQMDLRAGGAEKQNPHAPAQYRSTILQRLSEPDRMYMLNDEKKTYWVMDLKKARDNESKTPQKYAVTRTGSDKVAGLSCDKALITGPSGSQVEVCVTRELAPSSAWMSVMNRDRSGFFDALRSQGLDGFPIRMITRDHNNRQIVSTYELVRVERKALPASTFEIPAGYKESSMASSRMTPEQERAMKDALSRMTPEQRKQYEEMRKKQQDKQ
jgi:uncharacterized protein DUF4412